MDPRRLSARIDQLEKKTHRLTVITVCLSAVVVCGAAMAANPGMIRHENIEARSIVLKDSKGKARVQLAVGKDDQRVALEFYDLEGNRRVFLELVNHGEEVAQQGLGKSSVVFSMLGETARAFRTPGMPKTTNQAAEAKSNQPAPPAIGMSMMGDTPTLSVGKYADKIDVGFVANVPQLRVFKDSEQRAVLGSANLAIPKGDETVTPPTLTLFRKDGTVGWQAPY